ncbi:hypothetical protein ACH4KN_15815 [Streptomyces sp. NPDC017546]|uniref:hypothetical protein n=1 Tax=unclassified Streptomyces TaxID=2593676 RepID=UPI002361CE9A|nr:hypothetical protein [Streptomyces sp. MMBL 11-1]
MRIARSGPQARSGAYVAHSAQAAGPLVGKPSPFSFIGSTKPKIWFSTPYAQSIMISVAPSAAGMTTAGIGICLPRSPGAHRGTTSPHGRTSPRASSASPSETTDSPITYGRSHTAQW